MKLLRVLAVLALCVFLLYFGRDGASHKEQGSLPSSGEERVEITLAFWDADAALAGDEVLRTIEEKFNIKITPVNLTWDDYDQRVKMWAASGNLPDLFVGDFRHSIYYPKWVRQGLLKEIPGDLSDYPHLQEYLSNDFAEDAGLDGKMYCIPRMSYPSQAWTSIDRYICYRWDLAQKAGVMKEPETWQEFEDMMLKIIEADPERTGIRGLTSSDKGLLNGVFMPYASSIALDEGTGFKWVKADDGTYQPAYFYEDPVPGFALARKLYQSGAIDPEIAMTTNASANENFLKGENAAIAISGGFGNKYGNISIYWEEYHDHSYLEDVKALKLMPDQNGNKAYSAFGYAWSESYINGTVSEEKLSKILQLYDYLLSDEGAFFGSYGPEGENYVLKDGKAVPREEDQGMAQYYPSCGVFSRLVRWLPSLYDDRFISYQPDEYDQVDRERVREAEQVVLPEWYPECQKAMLELGIDFSLHLEEDFLTIMTGEEPVEEMWEDIRRQYEKDGLQDVIDKVNDAMRKERGVTHGRRGELPI